MRYLILLFIVLLALTAKSQAVAEYNNLAPGDSPTVGDYSTLGLFISTEGNYAPSDVTADSSQYFIDAVGKLFIVVRVVELSPMRLELINGTVGETQPPEPGIGLLTYLNEEHNQFYVSSGIGDGLTAKVQRINIDRMVDNVNDGDTLSTNEIQTLNFNVNTRNLTISGGNTVNIPGSAAAMGDKLFQKAQTAHGFSVMDIISWDTLSGNAVLADMTHLPDGIVISIPSPDSFIYAVSTSIEVAHGLPYPRVYYLTGPSTISPTPPDTIVPVFRTIDESTIDIDLAEATLLPQIDTANFATKQQLIDTSSTLRNYTDSLFASITFPTPDTLVGDSTIVFPPTSEGIVVYAPSHGLVIPQKGYVPVDENYDAALTSVVAYATEVVTTDSLRIVFSGEYVQPNHGLNEGMYYLQTDGSEEQTPDNPEIRTVFVVNDSTYIFTEQGVNYTNVLPRVPIPGIYITAFGGDPVAPSDSVIQEIAEFYAANGRIRAGSILVTQYPSNNRNPAHQAGLNDPSFPTHTWFWNGQVVTRIESASFAINMQDTLYGGLGTLELTPVATTPSDSLAADWLKTNVENNGLFMPNGSYMYYVGSGTVQNPDYIWTIATDVNYLSGIPNGNYGQIIKRIKNPGGSTVSTLYTADGSITGDRQVVFSDTTKLVLGDSLDKFPGYFWDYAYDEIEKTALVVDKDGYYASNTYPYLGFYSYRDTTLLAFALRNVIDGGLYIESAIDGYAKQYALSVGGGSFGVNGDFGANNYSLSAGSTGLTFATTTADVSSQLNASNISLSGPGVTGSGDGNRKYRLYMTPTALEMGINNGSNTKTQMTGGSRYFNFLGQNAAGTENSLLYLDFANARTLLNNQGYYLANSNPSYTLNDTTIMAQRGTGSAAVPIWINKNLFGSGGGSGDPLFYETADTISKTSHGFAVFTPIYWDGDSWETIVGTADTISSDRVVVEVIDANTFVAATGGEWPTVVADGYYWKAHSGTGYSTTQDTINQAVFNVKDGIAHIYPPLTLTSGATGGGAADGNGIISALPTSDVAIDALQNELLISNLQSVTFSQANGDTIATIGTVGGGEDRAYLNSTDNATFDHIISADPDGITLESPYPVRIGAVSDFLSFPTSRPAQNSFMVVGTDGSITYKDTSTIGGGDGDGIVSMDRTISENRTVSHTEYTLQFDATTATGIVGSSVDGTGVAGTSTNSTGVSASTGTGVGVNVNATDGLGVSVTTVPSTGDDITEVNRYTRYAQTAASVAAGIGGENSFWLASSNGSALSTFKAGFLRWVATDITVGSPNAELQFGTMVNNSIARRLTLTDRGTFNSWRYGQGFEIGTPAYLAGWTAGGDMVEVVLDTKGSVSTTTDGSGDVVVTHGGVDATFVADVQVTGTTLGVGATVHTKTATTFTVRLYDTSTKAALTSTAVEFDWILKDN